MLKRRIIPKLLVKNKTYGRLVRPVLVTTRGYDTVFEVGDPLSQAKIYEAQLADELIVLNIDRLQIGGDLPLLKVIEKLASETFMPLTVGGGVATEGDFETLLNHGADKVSINTAAVLDPELITSAAARFGAQCVVVSIDFRADPETGSRTVLTHGGSSATDLEVVGWATRAVEAGAGEILLTDVDRDGEGRGLNLSVGRAVVDAVGVPVILSGGCGVASDFVAGFTVAGVEAVAAGTFFCFRDQNPMQTRAHVSSAGVPIRVET
jgi:imidazole glycerol-phosphate synthase subunit HisF